MAADNKTFFLLETDIDLKVINEGKDCYVSKEHWSFITKVRKEARV